MHFPRPYSIAECRWARRLEKFGEVRRSSEKCGEVRRSSGKFGYLLLSGTSHRHPSRPALQGGARSTPPPQVPPSISPEAAPASSNVIKYVLRRKRPHDATAAPGTPSDRRLGDLGKYDPGGAKATFQHAANWRNRDSSALESLPEMHFPRPYSISECRWARRLETFGEVRRSSQKFAEVCRSSQKSG